MSPRPVTDRIGRRSALSDPAGMQNHDSSTREASFSIVGSGGDGAVVAGDLAAMACAARGLHVIKTESYGPQIRGGESSSTVRVAKKKLLAQADAIDGLVVFRFADFTRFRSEIVLSDSCVVFHEPDDAPPPELVGAQRLFQPIPFAALAKSAGAPGARNIVAIGLLAAVFGLPVEGLRAALRKRFRRRDAAVIEGNLRALESGFAEGSTINLVTPNVDDVASRPHLMMSGNEAAALGALHAGCTFFAGYPITPSSEVLHFLGEWLPRVGGTCVQTEDELSAIGEVIGASFAGAKAMTATSGPGLSLMSEMLGLSSIAEIPSVIVNVQRGGPSTGLPTRSEQSDLYHALYGSHGDTPRVVLAACDVEDAFHATVDAFNIAEEYQVPVIVLSDQLIGQRRETVEAENLVHDVAHRRVALPREGEIYERYADTSDGVSPMTVPGVARGMYQTNGLEHDRRGRPASSFVVHEEMNEKRFRKMEAIARSFPLFRRFGALSPELGILCWGSSTGTIAEAVQELSRLGNVAAFAPRILMPLPVEELQWFIDSCERLLVVELSYSAQFYRYLRSSVDLPSGKTEVYARSGGKTLTVAEVLRAAKRLLRAGVVQEVTA